MRLPHSSHTTCNPAAPKTCCDTNPHCWLTHHRESCSRRQEPQEGFCSHSSAQLTHSSTFMPSPSSRDSSPKQRPTASPAQGTAGQICACTPCCLQMCPAAGGWGGTAEMSRLREEQPEWSKHPSRPSRAQLQSHVAQNINTPWKRHTTRVKCTGRANTQLPSGPLTVFFYGYKERFWFLTSAFCQEPELAFQVSCPTAQLCCHLLPKLNPPPANFTSPAASGLSHHKAAFHYSPQT